MSYDVRIAQLAGTTFVIGIWSLVRHSCCGHSDFTHTPGGVSNAPSRLSPIALVARAHARYHPPPSLGHSARCVHFPVGSDNVIGAPRCAGAAPVVASAPARHCGLRSESVCDAVANEQPTAATNGPRPAKPAAPEPRQHSRPGQPGARDVAGSVAAAEQAIARSARRHARSVDQHHSAVCPAPLSSLVRSAPKRARSSKRPRPRWLPRPAAPAHRSRRTAVWAATCRSSTFPVSRFGKTATWFASSCRPKKCSTLPRPDCEWNPRR